MRERKGRNGRRVFCMAVLLLALVLPAMPAQAQTQEIPIQWLATKGRPAYYISEFDWITIGGSNSRVIDRKTEEVVEGYAHMFPFHEGLAVVTQKDGDGNSKRGYMDTAGNVVIAPEYDWANGFYEGVATVQKLDENGKKIWYVIDTGGNVLATLDYDDMGNFSCGLAWVHIKDGYYGYIDKTGAVVIPEKYSYTGGFSKETGLAMVRIIDDNGDRKHGYINVSGETVLPMVYDDANSFSGFNGLASVERDGSWSYIDSSGAAAFTVECDLAGSFTSDGMAMVRRYEGSKLKFGFINAEGELAVPMEYDSAHNFVDGLAAVMRRDEEGNEKWGFIDRDGTVVVPLEYKEVSCLGGIGWVQRYEDSAYGIFVNPYSPEKPEEDPGSIAGAEPGAEEPSDGKDSAGSASAPDSESGSDSGFGSDRGQSADKGAIPGTADDAGGKAGRSVKGILIACVAICAAAAAGTAAVAVVRKKRGAGASSAPASGQTGGGQHSELNFCPMCGEALKPGDCFCQKCGHPLKEGKK